MNTYISRLIFKTLIYNEFVENNDSFDENDISEENVIFFLNNFDSFFEGSYKKLFDVLFLKEKTNNDPIKLFCNNENEPLYSKLFIERLFIKNVYEQSDIIIDNVKYMGFFIFLNNEVTDCIFLKYSDNFGIMSRFLDIINKKCKDPEISDYNKRITTSMFFEKINDKKNDKNEYNENKYVTYDNIKTIINQFKNIFNFEIHSSLNLLYKLINPDFSLKQIDNLKKMIDDIIFPYINIKSNNNITQLSTKYFLMLSNSTYNYRYLNDILKKSDSKDIFIDSYYDYIGDEFKHQRIWFPYILGFNLNNKFTYKTFLLLFKYLLKIIRNLNNNYMQYGIEDRFIKEMLDYVSENKNILEHDTKKIKLHINRWYVKKE